MDQPEDRSCLEEDWDVLESFLPRNWQDPAVATGALKGLCKDKSAENLRRVLLLHLGCRHSLQETALRARRAQLAELTAAAVWEKSTDWLCGMCVELFRERGLVLAGAGGFQVRAFDATTVKEPGQTGSLWRIHYSPAAGLRPDPSIKETAGRRPWYIGAGGGDRQSRLTHSLVRMPK